mgnify:CR=1 FL=1
MLRMIASSEGGSSFGGNVANLFGFDIFRVVVYALSS